MPAKKNKSKSKKKGILYSPPEDFLERLHATRSWQDVADLLCEWLEIPDLKTRQGLKKVHRNFDDIVAKIDKLWDFAVQSRNHTLAGSIVAIYTRICVDSVLRDRVVRETGYLPKLFSLVEQPACRNVALEGLATMTHHAGAEVRLAIAEKAPLILQAMDDHLDDRATLKFGWTALSHGAGALLANEIPPSAAEVRALDVPRMIRSALYCMRQPNPSRQLAEHIMSFFSGATQHCSKDFFASPSAINFLLSCARNRDVRIRAEALGALLRLNIAKGRVEDIQMDPNRLIAALSSKNWPDHVTDRFVEFGLKEIDTVAIATTTRDLQNSMMRVIGDHDFLRLGREIGEYILRTEYAVPNGAMQTEDPKTRKLKIDSCGLPFTYWWDALPHCVRALREKGRPEEKDVADIIECKYLVLNRRVKDAHAVANAAIGRGAKVGFFYYILTLDVSQPDGLRNAKKGLKCKGLTNYVKFGLLYRSAEHACSLALPKLQEAGNDQDMLDEGYAFAQVAWEDTRNYILHAPPDSRSMLSVCYLHTVFSLLLHGHEQDPTLPQLKITRQALRFSEDVARHIGRSVTGTQQRLTAYLIFDKMEEAAKEWDAVTSLYGQEHSEPSEDKAEDGLTAWLNRAEPEDVDSRGNVISESHYDNVAVNLSDMPLYRCSWCGNPSAILRKCKGCSKARYCDAACQREHWQTSHRKVCARNHEKPADAKAAEVAVAA